MPHEDRLGRAMAFDVGGPATCREPATGGWLHHAHRADSRIAAVTEVGMPSVSKGTRVAVAAGLLAASGPATPSVAPAGANGSGAVGSGGAT